MYAELSCSSKVKKEMLYVVVATYNLLQICSQSVADAVYHTC